MTVYWWRGHKPAVTISRMHYGCYFGHCSAVLLVFLPPRNMLLLLALVTLLSHGFSGIDGTSILLTNNTDGVLVSTAIADGELGSRGGAAVQYDRRRVSDTGTYLPPYINGHSGGTRRAETEVIKIANEKEPTLVEQDLVGKQSSDSGGVNNVSNVSKGGVTETQSTTCHVTTEQLVATAQATVTRVVKGLVTSDDLSKQIGELVGLMTDRLSELKEALFKLENRVDDYNEALKRGKYQQMETLVPHCDKPNQSTLSDSAVRSKNSHQDGQKLLMTDLYENEAVGEDAGVREPEILKYNSSIHMEPSMIGSAKKVFTYYWRIRQMRYKLTEWNPRRSFRSQSFYIYPGGYRLYLRSVPRQNEVNFYIHVGITKGDFDEALKWPFPLRMRVAILDQTRSTRMFEDVTSRVWDPSQLCSEFNWQRPTKGDNFECVGLGFPHDVLYQRSYISSDSLVVKLTVYLDS